jgi:hypothetical protein
VSIFSCRLSPPEMRVGNFPACSDKPRIREGIFSGAHRRIAAYLGETRPEQPRDLLDQRIGSKEGVVPGAKQVSDPSTR